jgi:M6 family metalloprotease-like protein
MSRRITIRRALAAASALAAFFAPGDASAQDIRVQAQIAGRPLPPTYEARLRADPNAFEIRHGWTEKARLARRVNGVMTGTLPLVVVQALFQDSPEPQFTTEQVQRVIFDGPSAYGTLTDFYRETSRGVFTVTGRVLPWVRTNVPRAQAVDEATALHFLQALAAVDGTTDFGQFDNDGPDGLPNSGDDDGRVDAVAFHFLESAQACGGPGLWPHRSRLTGWPLPGGGTAEAFRTDDLRPNGQPIVVDDYITQSTVTCSGELLTSAVIAHELGHVLGLPDLYDARGSITPQNRRWVIGCWTLMAAGAWGCGDGAAPVRGLRPPHMGAWEKVRLGWAQEETAGDVLEAGYLLPPVASSGKVLRIPLRGTQEYYLVEYRPRTGFDVTLPAAGVLVYHVDTSIPFFPCEGCPRHYGVSLVEADGDGALVRTAGEGGNRGVAADAWGNGGRVNFTGTTSPATRTHAGRATAIALRAISLAAQGASFVLSTVFPRQKLLKAFLHGSGPDLTDDEKAAVDAEGNANGRYDIGDVRAYLLRHPSVGEE